MENRQYTMVPVPALEANVGQIPGLPRNPRLIRDARYGKLKQSLRDSPEFMELRPLIAVSQGDGRPAVVICGNMRLRACADLGWTEIPATILPADTPLEKLREYTVKDNVPYGETDWDILADEWDERELEDWGMDIPSAPSDIDIDDFFTQAEGGGRDRCERLTVEIPAELGGKREDIRATVEDALSDYKGVRVR